MSKQRSGLRIDNINKLFGLDLNIPFKLIPLGISFFTFEAVSFIADVYRNEIKDRQPWLKVFLYLSFFSCVTSGPIIRFNTFSKGFKNTEIQINNMAAIRKIIIGLGKKVLIADKLGIFADYFF